MKIGSDMGLSERLQKRFDDKVVVITGAASGIGKGFALRFLDLGCKVALLDYDEKGLNNLATSWSFEPHQFMLCPLNVTDYSSYKSAVEKVVERWQRIDVLFNNAGIVNCGFMEDLSRQHWSQIVGVNITGVINGIQLVYPLMQAQGNGHIINTASLAGLVALGGMAPYTTTKHAIVGLSRSLAMEAKIHGIKIQVLSPSFIDTPMIHQVFPNVSQEAINKLLSFFGVVKLEDFMEKAMAFLYSKRFMLVMPFTARLSYLLSRLFPSFADKLAFALMKALYEGRNKV